MLTTMHIYAVGRERETREVDLAKEPGYLALKTVLTPLLDGADLEHVSVLFEGRRADMFVDEIGANKGLPRNEPATTIYRANWLAQRPEERPESLPAIYGPAVVFARRVWF